MKSVALLFISILSAASGSTESASAQLPALESLFPPDDIRYQSFQSGLKGELFPWSVLCQAKLSEMRFVGGYVTTGVAAGGNEVALEKLLEQGADIQLALSGAALVNNEPLIEKLLQRGADVNGMMYGAVLSGRIESVKKALERGAKSDAGCFLPWRGKE